MAAHIPQPFLVGTQRPYLIASVIRYHKLLTVPRHTMWRTETSLAVLQRSQRSPACRCCPHSDPVSIYCEFRDRSPRNHKLLTVPCHTWWNTETAWQSSSVHSVRRRVGVVRIPTQCPYLVARVIRDHKLLTVPCHTTWIGETAWQSSSIHSVRRACRCSPRSDPVSISRRQSTIHDHKLLTVPCHTWWSRDRLAVLQHSQRSQACTCCPRSEPVSISRRQSHPRSQVVDRPMSHLVERREGPLGSAPAFTAFAGV